MKKEQQITHLSTCERIFIIPSMLITQEVSCSIHLTIDIQKRMYVVCP